MAAGVTMVGQSVHASGKKSSRALVMAVTQPRALSEVLDDLPDQVAVLDDHGIVVAVNQQWRKCAQEGNSPIEGRNYLDVLRERDHDGRAARALASVLGGQNHRSEWESSCPKESARRWFFTRATRLQRGGVMLVHTDITSRKLAELKLRDEAHRDPLTGLLNRRGLERRWRRAPGAYGAGLMVDCDDFKAVNEYVGHAGGDAVLQELANRFRGLQQQGHRIARVGGDEFVWLLPGEDTPGHVAFADRIRWVIAQTPIVYRGTPVRLTVSVACVSLQSGVRCVRELLEATEATLRASKGAGKNRVSHSGNVYP